MVSKSKKICCLLLVLLIMCTIFTDTLTPQAEAAEPITATMIAIEWFLGAAGLTFGSAGAAHDAAIAFYNSSPTTKADLDILGSTVNVNADTGKKAIELGSTALESLKRLYVKVTDFFKPVNDAFSNIGELPIPSQDFSLTAEDIIFSNIDSSNDFDTAKDLYACTGYDASIYTRENPFEVDINGVVYKYCFEILSDDDWTTVIFSRYKDETHKRVNINNGLYDLQSGFPSMSNYIQVQTSRINQLKYSRFGFYSRQLGNIKYLVPFLVIGYTDTDGVIHYLGGFTNDIEHCTDACIPYDSDVSPLVETLEFYRYVSLKLDKLLEKLGILVDTAPNGLTIPVDDISGQVDDGAAEKEDDVLRPYVPNLEWLKSLFDSLSIPYDDILVNPTYPEIPDSPNAPGSIPDIGGTWDYVSDFLADALIWMKLWFSGFLMLPQPVQTSLWAVLVITVVLGLLKVFLQ